MRSRRFDYPDHRHYPLLCGFCGFCRSLPQPATTRPSRVFLTRNGLVWSGLEVKPDQTSCFGLVWSG